MKLSYIIIGSLGLNAILVAGVVHQRTKAVPTATEEVRTSGAKTVAEKKLEKAKEIAAKGPLFVNVPGEAFSWLRIEAEDYHRYVANLRAIGCPEETIQDIITSDVNKVYAEKFRALNRQYRRGVTSDYWKTDDQYSYNAEHNRKYRELSEEKKALLIELLGVDVEKARRERQGLPDYEALRMAWLPEAKRKQVEDIRQRFQDQEQALYVKYRDYYGEERNLEFAEINKQRLAELAKILTPQELEDFKVRNSQTASQMKHDLQAFEPNEQEFRALFKAREAYDEATAKFRFSGPDPDDPQQQKLYADASKARDEEIKKLLGETRYAEYTRSQDYNYRELYRMAERSGLPKDTAAKVYDVKEATEAQARKVRSDQSLSAEQRQQALTEIKSLAERSIQESLGEKNFKSYQSRHYGSWMRGIAPEPPRSSTTTIIR
ncbi:MAG TPA: hypothetical protein VGH19_13665 [Verrucomicrobiae bacterium]